MTHRQQSIVSPHLFVHLATVAASCETLASILPLLRLTRLSNISSLYLCCLFADGPTTIHCLAAPVCSPCYCRCFFRDLTVILSLLRLTRLSNISSLYLCCLFADGPTTIHCLAAPVCSPCYCRCFFRDLTVILSLLRLTRLSNISSLYLCCLFADGPTTIHCHAAPVCSPCYCRCFFRDLTVILSLLRLTRLSNISSLYLCCLFADGPTTIHCLAAPVCSSCYCRCSFRDLTVILSLLRLTRLSNISSLYLCCLFADVPTTVHCLAAPWRRYCLVLSSH
ncbi:hypothetical protein J6590_011329 [Homalodisca vitripennis]|nr:hypothetical protein J6590_011329 [Homalodisca vitripennis]